MRADFAIALALLTLFAASGCATRKPGKEYLWVPVCETHSIDGVTESYLGIGRLF